MVASLSPQAVRREGQIDCRSVAGLVGTLRYTKCRRMAAATTIRGGCYRGAARSQRGAVCRSWRGGIRRGRVVRSSSSSSSSNSSDSSQAWGGCGERIFLTSTDAGAQEDGYGYGCRMGLGWLGDLQRHGQGLGAWVEGGRPERAPQPTDCFAWAAGLVLATVDRRPYTHSAKARKVFSHSHDCAAPAYTVLYSNTQRTSSPVSTAQRRHAPTRRPAAPPFALSCVRPVALSGRRGASNTWPVQSPRPPLGHAGAH